MITPELRKENTLQEKNYYTMSVSEVVRDDYRTADVFRKYGINYCCGGQVPVAEACAAKNADVEALVNELKQATRNITLPNSLQYNDWKIDFLIDYITNVHHAYLKNTLPVLEGNLLSFVNSHKKQHPELERIMEVFSELAAVLMQHTRYEEETLFPYIRQIENTHRRKESYGRLFVRTMRKPLGAINGEHDKIASLLQVLRDITHNYAFKGNACTNHRVVFNKLREFDNDLVQHKHLENNILLPRAIAMEQDLLEA